MFEQWAQRVGSAVPRGFSRYYILKQLQKMPHTGKEIINSAVEESDGKWKPSPGLIYPLLGRLLDEGLIEETEDGKYQITNINHHYDTSQTKLLICRGRAPLTTPLCWLTLFVACTPMKSAPPPPLIQ